MLVKLPPSLCEASAAAKAMVDKMAGQAPGGAGNGGDLFKLPRVASAARTYPGQISAAPPGLRKGAGPEY